MPSCYLSPVFGAGAQLFTNQGTVLNGGKIWTYRSFSSTPETTYNGPFGGIANSNPITLDSYGRPPTEIWLTGGIAYRFIVTDSVGAPVGVLMDNISGVNDNTNSLIQWVNSGLTPSYASAVSFTTVGDSTSTYQVGRRVKCGCSSGYVYGTIVSSTYSSSTTVTLMVDSTSLDSGLYSADVGLLTAVGGSSPITQSFRPAFVGTASASLTGVTVETTVITYGGEYDQIGSFNPTTGIFTCPIAGIYAFRATLSATNPTSTVAMRFAIKGSTWGAICQMDTPSPGIISTVYSMTLSGSAHLATGETVKVTATPPVTGASVVVASFSGELIG